MMPLVRTLVVATALTAATGIDAQAQIRFTLDTGSVVVTSGTGEVNLSPDRANLRLKVETRATSAADAASANNVTLHRVLDSLNAMRLPSESVLVVSVAVRPNENYQSGALSGYTASAVLKVATRSLDRVSVILDRALSSGVTGVESVAFVSDREEAARGEALARAYDRARVDAEALARAAGATVGALLRLETVRQFGPADFLESGYSVGPATAVPIAPHDVVVRATVQATWRISSR